MKLGQLQTMHPSHCLMRRRACQGVSFFRSEMQDRLVAVPASVSEVGLEVVIPRCLHKLPRQKGQISVATQGSVFSFRRHTRSKRVPQDATWISLNLQIFTGSQDSMRWMDRSGRQGARSRLVASRWHRRTVDDAARQRFTSTVWCMGRLSSPDRFVLAGRVGVI